MRTAPATAAALAALLFASGAGAASLPPPGALSCTGCHAATKGVDTPVPPLAGRNPADIEAAMKAFRSGERPAAVMDRIAKGFTDAEVKAIAQWYGAAQP